MVHDQPGVPPCPDAVYKLSMPHLSSNSTSHPLTPLPAQSSQSRAHVTPALFHNLILSAPRPLSPRFTSPAITPLLLSRNHHPSRTTPPSFSAPNPEAEPTPVPRSTTFVQLARSCATRFLCNLAAQGVGREHLGCGACWRNVAPRFRGTWMRSGGGCEVVA